MVGGDTNGVTPLECSTQRHEGGHPHRKRCWSLTAHGRGGRGSGLSTGVRLRSGSRENGVVDQSFTLLTRPSILWCAGLGPPDSAVCLFPVGGSGRRGGRRRVVDSGDWGEDVVTEDSVVSKSPLLEVKTRFSTPGSQGSTSGSSGLVIRKKEQV